MAVVPMMLSVFGLQSSGDRATQMAGVVLVAVFAAPIAFLVAAGFLVVHGGLRRRGSVAPWGYIVWGATLMLVVMALVRFANDGGGIEPRHYAIIALGGMVVGAILGMVFWWFAVRRP